MTPSVPEATLYVLGIRADTGGLAYETTTARDADALAWLLRKGASQAAIAEFGVERISGDQRKILATALRTVESRLYRGVGVATVAVRSKGYVPGLAAVVEELLELTAADVLIMACEHQNGWISLEERDLEPQPWIYEQSCRNLEAAATRELRRRPCPRTTARPWARRGTSWTWRGNMS